MSEEVCSYESAISAAMEAESKGVGVYDMEIAVNIRDCVQEKLQTMKRRKKASEKLRADEAELFRIARDVFRDSAGASSPKSSAESVVECYVRCGLDLNKTVAYTMTSAFACLFRKS